MTDSTSRLHTEAVSLGYGDRLVVDQVSVEIPDGKVTVVVGPNACGKSTLLKGLARLVRPQGGAVILDGQEIHKRPTKEVAKVLGLLPQNPIAPDGVVVADLVGRGRHPHQGVFTRWSAEDRAAVEEAMVLTDTAGLADRVVDELSGGQRQRVWIAMALAQGTDLLLLDEPTTFLDVAHQVEMLDLLHDLNVDRGTTVVMVLHDLNLAARYADHLIAVSEGRVYAVGDPSQVLDTTLVQDVFGMQSAVIDDPVSGTPLVVPIGRHRCNGRGVAQVAEGER
ncbi:iron complex transport system ATP-binding protein [Nocardioides exalbidus]|uniref:Iron complex transport system ATP-binding protein n=1 Tax=Nocardioides exalbidus TaxID=402596 RepID=A0A1H4MH59_9ACTN|nr:ABC transporter ATP-binding protein [Nocardioides exalbidus]SEB82440.1 iron complex transport system ATP-binding protein [Nocardioides exalbidus]